MLRNYFKIAWRNLIRHKGYSFINIAGLAMGIASCLLLFMVVHYELSFDRFQKNYSRIYRIVTEENRADDLSRNPGVPYPMPDLIRANYPQLKTAAIHTTYGSQITVLDDQHTGMSNKKFIEDMGVFFMQPEFFNIFVNYTFLSGKPASLGEPGHAVLAKSVAEKYFGNWQDAVGKTIMLDNLITVKIAAIIDDVPDNSDLPLRVMVSYDEFKQYPHIYGYDKGWGSLSSNSQLFVLTPENMTDAALTTILSNFSTNQYKELKRQRRTHVPQPLSEMHFDTRYNSSLGDHTTSRATIRTLVLVGLLIIVMASINFINLATAQAVGRSKEVGVRKVLGGNRLQLFWQMMGETAIVVLIALVLAAVLAKLALPYIKHVASVPENLPLFNGTNIGFLILTGLGLVLLSGSYPSLVLSGFSPALALKNKINAASVGGISLRRGLVVLQFAISQILIIGTIVAMSQMDFVRHADLGFNKDAIFIVNGSTDSASIARQAAFKQVLLQIPGTASVSFNSDAPSSDNNWSSNFAYDRGNDLNFPMFLKFGDEDYLKTFGLQLAAGRNYTRSDTIKEVLVNETVLKKLGLRNPDDAIGKTLRLGSGGWNRIVGVVKDFKTNSLREEIKPTLISSSSKDYGRVAVKLHNANIISARKAIEAAWNKYYPEYAFSGSFLDENIARFYQQEEQLSLLYKIFAGLAIFISCLGLYGLVSFMAVQRVKEVGIRKVLGASIGNIVYLFSKEFTILITIAFVIAVPVAWWLMSNWLNNFAYRISMGIGVFALAVIISIGIAWITVGYKAIKAAVANPVKSLRTE